MSRLSSTVTSHLDTFLQCCDQRTPKGDSDNDVAATDGDYDASERMTERRKCYLRSPLIVVVVVAAAAYHSRKRNPALQSQLLLATTERFSPTKKTSGESFDAATRKLIRWCHSWDTT